MSDEKRMLLTRRALRELRARITRQEYMGPREVGELLCEVAEGEDLDRALEAYGRLTPDLLKTLGGDRFPPSPVHAVPS